MDNNSNKKNSGLIALLVIAVIIITVIIIAVVTSNKDSNTKDTKDSVKDPAESELDKIDTEIADDITDMVNDVTDDLLDGKESDDRKDKETDKTTEKDNTEETNDSSADTTEVQTSKPGITASVPTEFCLPVTGHISKDYSMDLPVFSLTMNDYRTHSGIDIQAEIGTNVAAFAEGTVTDSYTDPFMGVCVEITHSGGMVSRYMNLGEEIPESVALGSKVDAGQTIGTVGCSAAIEAADEPHLHFEVVLNDLTVDPMNYIEAQLPADNYEE